LDFPLPVAFQFHIKFHSNERPQKSGDIGIVGSISSKTPNLPEGNLFTTSGYLKNVTMTVN